MRLHTHLFKTVFGKTALAAATLGGLLFFAGAPKANAADRDCERRIARTEYKLDEAIERHGYYSRQANHWRHERREAYEHCHGRYDRDRYERRYYRDYDRDRY